MNQENCYSTKEVAEMSGLSISTVHAYVQEGKLKPMKDRR
ncbi:helix-turn-helix domain-containing protein [Domibacillus indicus]